MWNVSGENSKNGSSNTEWLYGELKDVQGQEQMDQIRESMYNGKYESNVMVTAMFRKEVE